MRSRLHSHAGDLGLDIIPGFDLDSIASFVLYGLGVGFPILMCGLPMVCWWWKTRVWKCRDCWCIKRCMRSTGVDSFDDFEAIISIHEATHQNKSNGATSVAVRAGNFEVETDSSTHSNFQQSFVLTVEQGTDSILVELLDSGKRKMATLKLDPIKDILRYPDGVSQKTYTMKTKQKGVGAARIMLTIKTEKPGDEERGLLTTHDGKPHALEVEFALREQLRKVDYDENTSAGDQLFALAGACTGPVDYFSYFGVATPGVLAVLGPPHRRRWTLGFWQDPAELSRPGDVEVDLMRISSVQEDPGRSEVFVISYADQNRVESRLLFRRTDRARDVWVHLLTMHISGVREMRQQRNSEYMSMKKDRPSSAGRQASIKDASTSSVRKSTSQRAGSASHVRRSRSERPTSSQSANMARSSTSRVSRSASRTRQVSGQGSIR